MTLLSTLATIFGIVSGLANIPQWIKIFKRKSAKDISVITYLLFFIGTIIWIFYGIEINELPVILSNIIGGINIFIVIIGWFLYGRNKSDKVKERRK